MMQYQTDAQPASLVCVAAPADTPLLEQWEDHLLPLVQAGMVTVWSPRHLQAGANRQEEIFARVECASYLVLLLSSDFFASEECYSLMKHGLKLHQEKHLSIIPLVVRPVTWQNSALGTLPCMPANGVPITTWEPPDEGWTNAVRELLCLLGEAEVPPSEPSSGIPGLLFPPLPTTHTGQGQMEATTCPRCGRIDRVEKVSALVASGDSALCQWLSFPEPPAWVPPPRQKLSGGDDAGCLLGCGGCSLLLVLSSIPSLVGAVSGAVPIYAPLTALALGGVGLCFVFFAIRASHEEEKKEAEKQKKEKEMKAEREYQRVQQRARAYPQWDRLYYCARDDIVFIPGVANWWMAPSQVGERIFQQYYLSEVTDGACDAILSSVGSNKIQVIKVIRELTGLGLKEAKTIVDEAPRPIKEAVTKEEARRIADKMEEVGATVTIKEHSP